MELLKQLLVELNIPDTIENRELLITLSLNSGMAHMALSAGALVVIKEKIGIDPLANAPKDTEENLVDGLCPSCQVRPGKLPDGRTVCNCRQW